MRGCHELITPAIFQTLSIMKCRRTPSTTPGMVDYHNADHEQLMKRLWPAPSLEEVILMIF